jgi:hypothetical protein
MKTAAAGNALEAPRTRSGGPGHHTRQKPTLACWCPRGAALACLLVACLAGCSTPAPPPERVVMVDEGDGRLHKLYLSGVCVTEVCEVP